MRKKKIKKLSNIINYYDKLGFIEKKIDSLNEKDKEFNKSKILLNNNKYIKFLKKIIDIPKYKLISYAKDFSNDKRFKKIFLKKLDRLNKTAKTGDIRFHSFTLYLIVRAIKPKLIIETGVCNGKSSAMILLALAHNKYGTLVSIDKILNKNLKLKDNTSYNYVNNKNAYLVPSYLKKRWKFFSGDSVFFLKKFKKQKKFLNPDIFFHDSLHTYKHVTNEISSVLNLIENKNKILIIVDDIDMGSGLALNNFLKKNNLIGYAFRNLGGINFLLK
jgi:hypothetical protein